jgi:sulfane dehydrogenase subunit SoxC
MEEKMKMKPLASSRDPEQTTESASPDDRERPASRRRFLAGAAALTGTALASNAGPAIAQGAENLPPSTPKWMKEPGDEIRSNRYGQPSAFEKNVIRRDRGDNVLPGVGISLTPWQNLRGTLTPGGLVFERHHGGIPQIDPAQHRLMIHGMVKKALVFTMDGLMRLPSVTRTWFLECSGNTGREWKSPLSKSLQVSHGLLSNCEWTGVPLSAVLEEAGLLPGAAWVLAEGADSAAMTRSIPLAKCLEDATLVYAQNGEMLRPEQGYPLRLFLPGWEGNMSVKWLRRLKVGDQPFQTREETAKYTDSMPDGTARQFTFNMEAKSVITYPACDHRLKGPGFCEISGVAWTGNGRIKRVDVSVDGGRNWREAALQEPVLSRALTRFTFAWRWDGGPAILQSRAMDETGYVQPTRAQIVAARGTNNLYHYNAIQSWSIARNGEIANVHA